VVSKLQGNARQVPRGKQGAEVADASLLKNPRISRETPLLSIEGRWRKAQGAVEQLLDGHFRKEGKRKIQRWGDFGMRTRRRFTVIDLMCGMMVLAILAALTWPILSRRREAARRAACLGNLKHLMTAIKTYAPDYDDNLPSSTEPGKEINVKAHYRDLGILYPTYVTSLEVFTCPSSGHKIPRRENDRYDNKPFRTNEAKRVSYAYSYNGEGGRNRAWTEAAPSTTRILADRHAGKKLTTGSNHKMDGRNVAFQDGHVRWVAGKAVLLTDPDNSDTKSKDKSWWSERPDAR
jgi:prepilin-type processing-associated H-X9-DG protein